jgi:hypothetical protein
MVVLIYTNAPVNQPAYMEDRDGAPVPIVVSGTYRCDVKRTRDDPYPILTFETKGDTGTISVLTGVLDGATRDYFLLKAAKELTANLLPGSYFSDIIRIDPIDPQLIMEFDVIVKHGVSAP